MAIVYVKRHWHLKIQIQPEMSSPTVMSSHSRNYAHQTSNTTIQFSVSLCFGQTLKQKIASHQLKIQNQIDAIHGIYTEKIINNTYFL